MERMVCLCPGQYQVFREAREITREVVLRYQKKQTSGVQQAICLNMWEFPRQNNSIAPRFSVGNGNEGGTHPITGFSPPENGSGPCGEGASCRARLQSAG